MASFQFQRQGRFPSDPMPNPPDSSESTLTDFIGTRDSFLVIRDPQLAKTGKQARAQLRSLPLLPEFGLDRVAHPGIYDNGLRLVEYELYPNENLRDNGIADVEFPLFTTSARRC